MASNNVKPIEMDLRDADVSTPLYCLQNFTSKTIVSHGLAGSEEISVEIKWGVGDDDFEQATTRENGSVRDIILTADDRSATIYGPAIIRLRKTVTAADTTAAYIDTKGM